MVVFKWPHGSQRVKGETVEKVETYKYSAVGFL